MYDDLVLEDIPTLVSDPIAQARLEYLMTLYEELGWTIQFDINSTKPTPRCRLRIGDNPNGAIMRKAIPMSSEISSVLIEVAAMMLEDARMRRKNTDERIAELEQRVAELEKRPGRNVEQYMENPEILQESHSSGEWGREFEVSDLSVQLDDLRERAEAIGGALYRGVDKHRHDSLNYRRNNALNISSAYKTNRRHDGNTFFFLIKTRSVAAIAEFIAHDEELVDDIAAATDN